MKARRTSLADVKLGERAAGDAEGPAYIGEFAVSQDDPLPCLPVWCPFRVSQSAEITIAGDNIVNPASKASDKFSYVRRSLARNPIRYGVATVASNPKS
jgi:hypothetical protein